MAEIVNFKGETRHPTARDLEDDRLSSLLRRVGERVRKTRELKGLSRRALAEKSGLSQRYLAQLEAGEGNISIGLLQQLAGALGFRMEWFVGEDDPWTSEIVQATDLFRAATAEKRRKAMQLLTPHSPQSLRASRICLIGLRGAGKSTLGAMVGRMLETPFVELSREMEDHSGIPANEIMAMYGQEGYRMLEAQALGRIIATHETVLLAVAGGLVSEPDTYKTLLSNFHTVWIQASAEEHMARVLAQGDTRPMADNPEAMKQLQAILHTRAALYTQAEAKLDTRNKPPRESADELTALIREQGWLENPARD